MTEIFAALIIAAGIALWGVAIGMGLAIGGQALAEVIKKYGR